MRAILREIGKGFKNSIEVQKAFFSEWYECLPYGIGSILKEISDREGRKMGYDEVIVPPSILGKFSTLLNDVGNTRAPEVGNLRAYFGKDYVKGYSKRGFFVEKGKKSEAIAFLRSIGLNAE